MTTEDRATLKALRWAQDTPHTGSASNLDCEVTEAFHAAVRANLIGYPGARTRRLTATGAARLTALEAQEAAEHAPSSPRYASGPKGDDLVARLRDRVVLRRGCRADPAQRGVVLGLLADGETLSVRDDEGDARAWPCSIVALLSRAQPPAAAMDDNEGRGWDACKDLPPHRLDAASKWLCQRGLGLPVPITAIGRTRAIHLDAERCQACEDVHLRREAAPGPTRRQAEPLASDAVERFRRDGTVVIPSDAHTCNPCNAGTPGACLACDAIGAADDAGIEWRETAPTASPAQDLVPVPRRDRELYYQSAVDVARLDALVTTRRTWLTESRRPTHARGRCRLAVMSTPWNPED